MDYLIEAMDKINKMTKKYDPILNISANSENFLLDALKPIKDTSDTVIKNKCLGVPFKVNPFLPDHLIMIETRDKVKLYDMVTKEIYKIDKDSLSFNLNKQSKEI